MNALLNKALEAVAALPESDQIEVAEGLIAYAELALSGQPLLTPYQQAGVTEAQAEVQNGCFATDTEMAEAWRKFGL
jgi:hypothetical protein